MAIYIIDQFSLNTDLPLDVRYVPTTGRFDPDISIYKYPGMQVYDTNDQTIWYCDNSLDWVEIGAAADVSINALIDIVNRHDVSIGDIYNELAQLEASIGDIDVSLNDYGDLLQIHDTSIGLIEIRLTTMDTSIADLYTTQGIQDTSITDLYTQQAIQDTSIAEHDASIIALFNQDVGDDASISDLYEWNLAQDASIDDLQTTQAIQDASIDAIQLEQLAQDASIDDLQSTQAIQDVSIAANAADIVIIDGSITALNELQEIQDVSIGLLESSLGNYVLKSGDTMSGALTISSGGLIVTNDVSVSGNIQAHDGTFLGNVGVRGDFTVDGSTTFIDSTTLDISTNFIRLNTGVDGQPPEWLQSGVIIERGDASSYAIIFDETDTTFRVGQVWNPDPSGTYLDTQTIPVATRQDDPDDNGVAVWKSYGDNLGSFETDANYTYDGDVLTLNDASLSLGGYAGIEDLILVVTPSGLVKAIPSADASIDDLYDYIDGSLALRDTSINLNTSNIIIIDGSITAINLYQNIQDVSIAANTARIELIDGSITALTNYESIQDTSIALNASNITIIDGSITALDSSISDIYEYLDDLSTNNITGIENVGSGDASIYSETIDGSARFRTISGVGSVTVSQTGDVIEISGVDTGEANTTSNVGDGEGLALPKDGINLPFKTISTLDPSTVIITTDNSTLYIDLSIGTVDTDVSVGGLTDTVITDVSLNTHSNLEWDEASGKWINTDNVWWDSSLGTTTDDLGGITQGTDLQGLTLKEILFKILYEYQVPTLTVESDPTGGIYEKGLVSTQFAAIDVSWYATNQNYPLALLESVVVSKTGSGDIFTDPLGGVTTTSNSYTDAVGITNWGGTSRTINYNVSVTDNQSGETQPSKVGQASFTFYYRQFWGTVPGNTNINGVDSTMILGLSDSRLAGASDLNANFSNPGEVFVKYLYAFPDTISAPDNFGELSQIIDQNEFDLTDSFTTENEDVVIGLNNVRYRFYLSKHKVNTSDFGITFKF